MSPENERARTGRPDTGSSPELSICIPTAAELQAPTPQHLTLTKKAMQLSAPECFDLIGDMLVRFPHLKQPVAALCEGATK